MSHASESSGSGKSMYVNLLMICVLLLLLSFAMWLVWVTYFREHYDAGIIEVNYKNGMIGTVTAGAADVRNPHFHNDLLKEPGEESISACIVCHGDYPHAKSKNVRAFLNAHAYVMTCEVCHLETNDSTQLTYRWLDTESNTISESRVADAGYKAIPVEYRNGEIRRFDGVESLEAIKQYVKKQSNMSDAFRKAMIKETHVSVSQEAVSCHMCHDINSAPAKLYGDLAYPADRIEELQRIEVAGMVHKYQEFYMPSLMREQEAAQ